MAATPAAATTPTAAAATAGASQRRQLDGKDDRHRRPERHQNATLLSHGDAYNRPPAPSLRPGLDSLLS
jgi:hypothetical protein